MIIYELLEAFGIIKVLELAEAAGLSHVGEAILNTIRNGDFFDNKHVIAAANFENLAKILGYDDNSHIGDIIVDMNLEWFFPTKESEMYGVPCLRQK
jgi:hypothetical protein